MSLLCWRLYSYSVELHSAELYTTLLSRTWLNHVLLCWIYFYYSAEFLLSLLILELYSAESYTTLLNHTLLKYVRTLINHILNTLLCWVRFDWTPFCWTTLCWITYYSAESHTTAELYANLNRRVLCWTLQYSVEILLILLMLCWIILCWIILIIL